MKLLQFICLYFIFSTSMAKCQTYEWLSNAHFDTIRNIGNYHRFIQLCSPEEDSLMVSGKALFSNADIKHIGECRLTEYFKDTIFLRAIIEVKGKKQAGKLLNYFKSLSKNQYAQMELTAENIYSCRFISSEGNALNATFVEIKRKKRGILIIE